MDARPVSPAVDLGARLRTLRNDLHRAHENLAAGRLPPDAQVQLERVLEERLGALEAEVHARYLRTVASGVRHEPWKRRMN